LGFLFSLRSAWSSPPKEPRRFLSRPCPSLLELLEVHHGADERWEGLKEDDR
jgi:hypothetical protein